MILITRKIMGIARLSTCKRLNSISTIGDNNVLGGNEFARCCNVITPSNCSMQISWSLKDWKNGSKLFSRYLISLSFSFTKINLDIKSGNSVTHSCVVTSKLKSAIFPPGWHTRSDSNENVFNVVLDRKRFFFSLSTSSGELLLSSSSLFALSMASLTSSTRHLKTEIKVKKKSTLAIVLLGQINGDILELFITEIYFGCRLTFEHHKMMQNLRWGVWGAYYERHHCSLISFIL